MRLNKHQDLFQLQACLAPCCTSLQEMSRNGTTDHHSISVFLELLSPTYIVLTMDMIQGPKQSSHMCQPGKNHHDM